jgi:hypothetical protein
MNDLIAIAAATLIFTSVITWLVTLVYFLGVVFQRPWMMGHGVVNDCLLIAGLGMGVVVNLCGWHIIRGKVNRYLDSIEAAE